MTDQTEPRPTQEQSYPLDEIISELADPISALAYGWSAVVHSSYAWLADHGAYPSFADSEEFLQGQYEACLELQSDSSLGFLVPDSTCNAARDLLIERREGRE